MLATLRESPFNNKDWIFEMKYDGYRAVAECDGNGTAFLYSRNSLSFNAVYAPIVQELEKFSHPCILDGEVVVEDKMGRSQFQLLQNYQRTGEGDLKYYVFDLLELDGKDLTHLELIQRKELLKTLLENEKLNTILYSDHIQAKGVAFFKAALKNRLEGIIAKRANSTYQIGKRTGDWQKIKITNQQEAIICGITAPQGGRKFLGSLVLGVYENGSLEYVGNCGTGFAEQTLKDVYSKLKPLFVSKSPFSTTVKMTGTKGKVQWIKPALVCEVKFSEWTGDGSMRHPVFLGLRKDKKPKEVKREIASTSKKSKK